VVDVEDGLIAEGGKTAGAFCTIKIDLGSASSELAKSEAIPPSLSLSEANSKEEESRYAQHGGGPLRGIVSRPRLRPR